ncbi:MAG TPA: EVE domain-containing protein [Labilithrix sp.]|nr:EVE domain-containing protein [Labilithrix sp.]
MAAPSAKASSSRTPAKKSGRHYLVKSEPFVYAFDQLLADKKTSWDGVRNFEARNTLRAMKEGDYLLFYHSNEGKEIVGIARVSKEAYQDPTTDEDWSAVEVSPVKKLTKPVSLATIKAHPVLSQMALVKRSRLSVVPVTDVEFAAVLKLGATKL